MRTTGQQIRIARTVRNMKQKDLGRQIGLSQKQLSRLEHDKAEPRVTTLRNLAEVLAVSGDFLLGFTEEIAHD